MNSIPNYSPAAFGTSGFHNGAASLLYQSSEKTAVVQEQSKEITLHTAEGDRVTLSASRETRAVYTRDDVLGYGRAQAGSLDAVQSGEYLMSGQSESFQLSGSRAFTLSIEGDLNAEEVRDIKKALVKIDKIMMQQLRDPGTLKNIRQVEKLRDLDTITGIEADYRSRTTTYTHKATAVQQETAVSPVETPREVDLANRMAGILDASPVETPKFERPLKQFFVHVKHALRDRPQREQSDTERLMAFVNRIRERLAEQLPLAIRPMDDD